MRPHLLTSALAAASLAFAQDAPVTSISTFTITKTVERVVETAYATLSSSSAAPIDTELPHEPTWSSSMVMPPAASASMAPLPGYNTTKPAPSGVMPNSTVSVVPQASGNAAVRFGSSESYAFAAIAGIVGLAVL